MSWLFSQALVEAYSAGNSLAGVQSVQLNVMPTQQQFWHKDKMMEPSNFSQFGLTLQLLTEDLGGELLTWFQEVSPARTLAVRGGDGLDGERSGLWSEMRRIVRQIRPRRVYVENSPMLTSRGLGTVLGDLAEMGFDAAWGVLGAHNVGGPHERDRIWIAADTDGLGLEGWDSINSEGHWKTTIRPVPRLVQGASWPDVSDPRAFGSSDGVAYRMERLKAIGNGQVPAVAAAAFRVLTRPV